jgi:hypothetical protein
LLLLLQEFGKTFDDFRFLTDLPTPELLDSAYQELQYLKADRLGRRLGEIPFLRLFYASVVLTWHTLYPELTPYIAFLCLIISSIENGRNYFVGMMTQLAIECYSPESDLVTLLNLLLPVVIDSASMEARGLAVEEVTKLRREFDLLAAAIGFSSDLSQFVELDHITQMDDFVSFLADEYEGWSDEHYCQFQGAEPPEGTDVSGTTIFKDARKMFGRPGAVDSRVPDACHALIIESPEYQKAQRVSLIHRIAHDQETL